MKIVKIIIIIYIFILIISCNDALKNENIITEECKRDEDCEVNMVCRQNSCIDDIVPDSDVIFSIELEPQNQTNNKYYYPPLTTEPIDIESLQKYKEQSFSITGIERYKIFGIITNSENDNSIEYNIKLLKQDSDLIFSKNSYYEQNNTYYEFNIPFGTYKANISPNKLYPPFSIIIENEVDDTILPINIDIEQFEETHRLVYGTINYIFNDINFAPDKTEIYAFIYNSDGEEIRISSKTNTCRISDENCIKNGYFSFLIDKNYNNYFLKIESDYFNNISFIKYISNSSNNIGVLNLGSFFDKRDYKFNFKGACGTLNHIKIELYGEIGEEGLYSSNHYPTCSNCVNITDEIQTSDSMDIPLHRGVYTVIVKPDKESCYSTKIYNFNTDDINNNEITISLTPKLPFKGKISSYLGDPISFSSIKFIKKNRSINNEFSTLSDESGNFAINIEPGLYDIFIHPSENGYIYSNWIYFNQYFDKNSERELNYFIPEGYKILLEVESNNNEDLPTTAVSFKLKEPQNYNIEDPPYPAEYKLYSTLSNENGFFYLTIPIIKK